MLVDTLRAHRALVVVRAPRIDDPGGLCRALVAGGIPVVEFTFTTPGVESVIAEAVAAVPEALVGVPQPADPGPHRVSIHRGGQELGAAEVTVESGREASVALEAPPPPPEPEGGDVVAAGGVETQWWFWTLIAVLAVGAGVGVGLAVWSESNNPQDAWLRGDDGRIHMTLVEVPW